MKNSDDFKHMIFDIEDDNCLRFVRRFRNVRRFLMAFRESYEFIIAYHSTRLDEKERAGLKISGLTTTSNELLKEKAHTRFVKPSDTPSMKQQIGKIIDDFFREEQLVTIGQINLVIDKELTEECYHYLLFGPESLLPLADNLRRMLHTSFRGRMADFGTPVIVKARVPVASTHDTWVQGIFEYIKNGFPDVSLVYRNDLPPENIIGILDVRQPLDRNGFLYM